MLAVNHYSVADRIIFLLGALLLFWDARRGLSTGTLWMGLGSIRRSDLAPMFWVCWAVNIVAGLTCLMVFIIGKDPW